VRNQAPPIVVEYRKEGAISPPFVVEEGASTFFFVSSHAASDAVSLLSSTTQKLRHLVIFDSMPRSRPCATRPQFDVLDRETQIEEERHHAFCGSARLDLDALQFDVLPEHQCDESNVRRLVSLFRQAGCQRLRPQHHIPATVTYEQLDDALARAASSRQALLHHDPVQWPLLIFPDAFRALCLHGRHRIEAAKRHLVDGDRWWVVDFYAPSE